MEKTPGTVHKERWAHIINRTLNLQHMPFPTAKTYLQDILHISRICWAKRSGLSDIALTYSNTNNSPQYLILWYATLFYNSELYSCACVKESGFTSVVWWKLTEHPGSLGSCPWVCHRVKSSPSTVYSPLPFSLSLSLSQSLPGPHLTLHQSGGATPSDRIVRLPPFIPVPCLPPDIFPSRASAVLTWDPATRAHTHTFSHYRRLASLM